MKDILKEIQIAAAEAVLKVYDQTVDPEEFLVTPTKKEHQGDYTLVTFAIAKTLRQPPPKIAVALGEYMAKARYWISGVEVVQGFLNISLADEYWSSLLNDMKASPDFWKPKQPKEKILVEFSSPNTNKPLHLGHIRNILLGWSTYKILQACGHEVYRVQIVNDRGIAICKSMLAWTKFSGGVTPDQAGVKSDHFVGDWYVRFEKEFQIEYKAWQQTAEANAIFEKRPDSEIDESAFYKSYKNKYFNDLSSLGKEARGLLLKWEANDPDTIALWKKMNGWVYAGFEETYQNLGVSFDKLYYESETYLLGKGIVEDGLNKKVFYQKEDGSVWVDLTDAGLDHKILLRSDGTSVYMTQDVGTAQMRYDEFGTGRMIYVVADEQNYHFQALFAIMAKVGAPYANGLHHLSYGMVDLPEGKMKSREGTVVDADDLMKTVIEEAAIAAEEREEVDQEVIRKIGMSALKYFIIKVDPRKRMTFDPKASVDMQGQTGPYIQNAYVRIQSIIRRAEDGGGSYEGYVVNDDEKTLLNMLGQIAHVIENAAKEYSPALVANYAFGLAKEYHRYYHEVQVLKAESEEAKNYRLALIEVIGDVLKNTMDLLGIEMPERM